MCLEFRGQKSAVSNRSPHLSTDFFQVSFAQPNQQIMSRIPPAVLPQLAFFFSTIPRPSALDERLDELSLGKGRVSGDHGCPGFLKTPQ